MPINQSERERASADTDKGIKALFDCRLFRAFFTAGVLRSLTNSLCVFSTLALGNFKK